jgi:hypothetical protein
MGPSTRWSGKHRTLEHRGPVADGCNLPSDLLVINIDLADAARRVERLRAVRRTFAARHHAGVTDQAARARCPLLVGSLAEQVAQVGSCFGVSRIANVGPHMITTMTATLMITQSRGCPFVDH